MSATKGGIKSPCTRRLCAARYELRVLPVAQASILRFLHIVPAKDDRAGSRVLRLSEVAHPETAAAGNTLGYENAFSRPFHQP
jgi:hypothetical protein